MAIIKAMLTKKAKDELRAIITKDYGVQISDEDAEELGVSLLRLTRVALQVRAREYEKEKKAN